MTSALMLLQALYWDLTLLMAVAKIASIRVHRMVHSMLGNAAPVRTAADCRCMLRRTCRLAVVLPAVGCTSVDAGS